MSARRARCLFVLAAFVALVAPGLAPLGAAAAAPDPRVVLVVGPVGSLTESYREAARAGAREARRWTQDVVEVYSPDATWPRVRAALQGASIVVYLGHGNGFPSPHGSELQRAVQNGFGLNPVADRGDSAHQYFGESAVAQQARLAPGAVVLLFHLCYASGLSEPGVAEGTEAVARERVDNYAAGFLAAGASAVVADAYASPAPYLRALLGTQAPARAAWSRASTANGNVRAFSSQRTPGAVGLMDPERASSGFSRSIVLAQGTAGVVPAGPGGNAEVPPGGWEIVLPPQPSPAPDAFALGASPGMPSLGGMPIAGSTVELDLPVQVDPGIVLGSAYTLGTRWIPLDVAVAPPSVASGGEIPLIAQESAASRVDVAPATTRDGIVAASVALPGTTGRYRLEVTIHDADGVALPYAVQASIPSAVVHVGGPGAAWLDAPPLLVVTAGTRASVQVLTTNGEAHPWGTCPDAPARLGPDAGAVCPTVRLVGRWVPITGRGIVEQMTRPLDVPAATSLATWLAGPVPAEPGTYLLVVSLERSTGDTPPQVLGRPIAVTVTVVAAPLVPTPPGG